RLAHVTSERDLWEWSEKLPQSLDLIVGECVHRVQEKRPNTVIASGSSLYLLQERVQYWKQEGLGFSGARPGGNNKVSSRDRPPNSLFLVDVQGAACWETRCFESCHPLAENSLFD